MKKIKIISGAGFLWLLILYLCFEIGCLLLCYFADVEPLIEHILLTLVSIAFGITLLVTNRVVTIVTYDPEKEIVTRRGLFLGFYRELRVADIKRTEVRMMPKEQEYILLIEKEMPYFDSWSPEMPIRVPNTAKGRAFVANFIVFGSDAMGDADRSSG